MEEHPDCQPRRAVAVNSGYHDDGEGNKDLESKRIDNGAPPDRLFYGIACVNPGTRSTGDVEKVRKALFL